MKNIRIFRTKKEYMGFLTNEIFTEKLIANNEFYKKLIQFVIDHKAPLFYEMSDGLERNSFSSYCHFQPMRVYSHETIRTMFFLHDFVHMLFDYPYDMARVSMEEFQEIMTKGEYVASDETEILIYYRIPELHKKVFIHERIFFDILKERGVKQPPLWALAKLRQQLIETDNLDAFFFTKTEDQEIKLWFKKWRINSMWNETRYLESLKVKNAERFQYRSLTPYNYERTIENYEAIGGEAEYQKLVLSNIQLAFAIVGLENPPTTFEECFEKIKLLENKVMFRPGNLNPKEANHAQS